MGRARVVGGVKHLLTQSMRWDCTNGKATASTSNENHNTTTISIYLSIYNLNPFPIMIIIIDLLHLPLLAPPHQEVSALQYWWLDLFHLDPLSRIHQERLDRFLPNPFLEDSGQNFDSWGNSKVLVKDCRRSHGEQRPRVPNCQTLYICASEFGNSGCHRIEESHSPEDHWSWGTKVHCFPSPSRQVWIFAILFSWAQCGHTSRECDGGSFQTSFLRRYLVQ